MFVSANLERIMRLKWRKIIVNLTFVLILCFFYIFVFYKYYSKCEYFKYFHSFFFNGNNNGNQNKNQNDNEKNRDKEEATREFWTKKYQYSPLVNIKKDSIGERELKDAIWQGLKLSDNMDEEYSFSLKSLTNIEKVIPNYDTMNNKCDPRIYEMVNFVLAPFQKKEEKEKSKGKLSLNGKEKKDERDGIHRHQIETAIFPFDDPTIPIKQFIVQVIDGDVWIDFSGARTSVWFEWQRATFVFGLLTEWVQVMKSYNRTIPDFEFVLETKDCPFIGADENIGEEAVLKAWETRRRLPIMSVFKCKNTNLIPVVQWLYLRDGSLDQWDPKWWNVMANCHERRPVEDKIDKAVFRGMFSPYSSFNELGETVPTRITSENINMTGRPYLHLLGRNNTEYLDIDVLEYWLYGTIVRGTIFGNTTYATDRRISIIDQLDKYQFAICAEGWCGWADRLRYLLHANVIILKQETNCGEYYQYFLRPWEHYIPVSTNYRDLVEKVKWARENLEKAKEIADNAGKLARELLTMSSMKCYQFILFEKYANLMKYKPLKRFNAVKWEQRMHEYVKRDSGKVGWQPNKRYQRKFKMI